MDGYGMLQLYSNGMLYDMGTITGVTDTLNKQIARTPIVSLPTDCTFALESETSNQFTFRYTRRTPLHLVDGEYKTYESDPDYANVSWKWTNSMWIEVTSTLLNRWQARQDGYMMYLNVARDSDFGDVIGEVLDSGDMVYTPHNELLPVYVKNVYLRNITYEYSAGQTDIISGSITMIVGGRSTFKQGGSSNNRAIYYTLVPAELPAGKSSDSFTITDVIDESAGFEYSDVHVTYDTEEGTAEVGSTHVSTGVSSRSQGGYFLAIVVSKVPLDRKYYITGTLTFAGSVTHDLNYVHAVEYASSIQRKTETIDYEDISAYEYIPLFGGSQNYMTSYNAYNEYNEYISKSDKEAWVQYMEAYRTVYSPNVSEVVMLQGRTAANAKEAKDYELDYSDSIDAVTDCIITGGPEQPFEKCELTVSSKRLSSLYDDLTYNVSQGLADENSELLPMPGYSRMRASACGKGTYTVANYQVKNNNITITGYVDAARLTGLVFADDITFTNAFTAIYTILTSEDYLIYPYTGNQFITNCTFPKFKEEISYDRLLNEDDFFKRLESTRWFDWVKRVHTMIFGEDGYTTTITYDNHVTVKEGQNVWNFLQVCAMILNCRLFFANDNVYLIDYTKLESDGRDLDKIEATSGTINHAGNRLIMRDGMDFGELPGADGKWGIENPNSIEGKKTLFQYDSMELHSVRTESRIGGRVDGSVDCPKDGSNTIINMVEVRGPNGVIIGFGDYVDINKNPASGLYIYKNKESGYMNAGEEDLTDIQKKILENARNSIEKYGKHSQVIDVSDIFASITLDNLLNIVLTVLAYRMDQTTQIKFKLAENYAPQKINDTQVDAYWSATFPIVCCAKRFTDVEQDLIVSAMSALDNEFHPEKLYLSTFSRNYPKYKSTYTFGEKTSVDLASSTKLLDTSIDRLKSSVVKLA